MRILFSIFFTLICVNVAFANIGRLPSGHYSVMSDFGINKNPSNLVLLSSISKSISQKDRRHFKDIIKQKPGHAYLIKSELDAINAPEFLLYLAMVESKLSNKATSKASAGGIWQFIPSTAKKYGLQVNSHIDERRDPVASTDAAFEYISYLKDYFGKWYLALMAYNCGEGCITRAIKKAGSDDLNVLIKSDAVPDETKNFIKNIIKNHYVANSRDVKELLSFDKIPAKLKKIPVKPGTKLADIGKNIGLPLKYMQEYNAHIIKAQAPKDLKGYYFYIPEKKYDMYMANLNKSNGKFQNKDYRVHIVAQNETIGQIANKWGISVENLKVQNKLKTDKISVKQRLKIPAEGQIASLDTKEYKIQIGDTLIGISKKFNINVNELASVNNIKNSKIIIGDKIVIP